MALPAEKGSNDLRNRGGGEEYLPHQEEALRCSVPALHRCATMRAYTINLAVVYLAEIAFATYVIGSYRTLEKRFGLSSAEIGALNTITDAVQVVSVLFIGYFGRNAHKPRVISVSVTFYVAGALLYAMPYFLYGSKEVTHHEPTLNGSYSSISDSTCSADNQSVVCSTEYMEEGADAHQTAYNLIALACVCLGIGGSCIKVMGFTYIDENVRAQDTPIYVGLAGLVIPIGPILGFLLAAVCTGIPENLRDSELSPEDPAYVGAWWLGFIIIGALVLLSSVPMFFFPKHLPQYYVEKRKREMKLKGETGNANGKPDASTKEEKSPNVERLPKIQEEIRGFLHSTWRLVSNVTLVVFTIHSVFDILVMLGLAANLTRYMEIQFNMPAFQANIVTAICVAVPSVIGNVLGGFIMKRMKLGVIGASFINTVTSAAIVVTLGVSMALGCDQVNVAGTWHKESFDVGMACNQNCSCTLEAFLPVCAPGGLNYLSPCHAGCTVLENATHYSDCVCVPGGVAMAGLCDQTCPLVVPYIIMVVLTCFSISLARVPTVVVNLRIVEPELKSFSLGIVSFADNLLGFIPAPIVFGALVDSACTLWGQDACGRQGACLLYDKKHYRLSVNGVCLAFQVLSLLYAAITWALVKRDVVNGKYENLEGEDSIYKNNNINHSEPKKGKENAAFESDSASLSRRPSLEQGQEWWIDDALVPATFKELEMTDRSSFRRHALVRASGEYSVQNKTTDSESNSECLKQDVLSEEKEIASVMQSAIEQALRLLTVTHHYVMDVIRMSGEYSSHTLRPDTENPGISAEAAQGADDICLQQLSSNEKGPKMDEIHGKGSQIEKMSHQNQATMINSFNCGDDSIDSEESTLKAQNETANDVPATGSSPEFLSVCFPDNDTSNHDAVSDNPDGTGHEDSENITILARGGVTTIKIVTEPPSTGDKQLEDYSQKDNLHSIPKVTVSAEPDSYDASRDHLEESTKTILDSQLSDIEEEKATDAIAFESSILQIEEPVLIDNREDVQDGSEDLSLPLPDAVSDNSVV